MPQGTACTEKVVLMHFKMENFTEQVMRQMPEPVTCGLPCPIEFRTVPAY